MSYLSPNLVVLGEGNLSTDDDYNLTIGRWVRLTHTYFMSSSIVLSLSSSLIAVFELVSFE